jgi:hypothetical protein
MFDHKLRVAFCFSGAAAGFHRDTQCKSFKRLVCRECQNLPDCCQKLATKGVKAVGAHLLTNPPVGEMGHGAYWPRLHGRGHFCGRQHSMRPVQSRRAHAKRRRAQLLNARGAVVAVRAHVRARRALQPRGGARWWRGWASYRRAMDGHGVHVVICE